MTGSVHSVAWRAIATTIPNLSSQDYRNQLIYETPGIRDFLDDIRGDKYIISAPKGFGKSLLLIARTAQIIETSGGLVTGAGGQLIDRPSGVFPNFSTDKIHILMDDYQFWKNIWKISIMASAVKSNMSSRKLHIKAGQMGCDPLLDEALSDRVLYQSATSFFTLLVESPLPQQIAVINNLGKLTPYFLAITSQVSFCIDNVDEYFKPILENNAVSENCDDNDYYKGRSNAIWTLAQLALAGAAYEVTQSNSHVKVFCTIRREAFLEMQKYDDQVQQIQGATLSIEYDKADYLKIFEKNIELMAQRDLVEPECKELIASFVGASNCVIKHRIVAKDEDVFSFILRHTLFRPRDLMHIGSALASLRPNKRMEEGALRKAVSESSRDIVDSLIKEMSPFFSVPDMKKLLSVVTHNVMAIGELSRVCREYLAGIDRSCVREPAVEHPFCVLFKIGLVGIIRRDGIGGEAKQKFLKPFEITFDDECGLPPTDEYYLVHSALDHDIVECSGHRYITNYHSQNVIGDDLDWREPLDSYFVLKGDVCGFSDVMSTELYPAIANRLYIWARAACETLHYFDVFGGDSVVFIDRSPQRLLDSAFAFLKSAHEYRERPLTLRFGGSAGPITFQKLEGLYAGRWQELEVPLGSSLRTSARIEPFAPHGQILVDEEFRRRAGELTGFVFAPVGEELSCERDDDGYVVIRKGAGDAPFRTKLWTIGFAQNSG